MELQLLHGQPKANVPSTYWRTRFQGWRLGALNCASAATVVCVVNFTVKKCIPLFLLNDRRCGR